jgi:hypothetical protein
VLQTYLGVLSLTLIACGLYLALAGVSDDTIGLLLRVTARVAFVVLLVVFIARPLRQLVRTPFTLALLKNRARVGLAFAGIHTGHLLVLVYRAREMPDFQLGVAGNTIGAFVYALMFAMVVTTFRAPARAIGPRAWRILHKTGLYVLTAVFAQTQLPRSLDAVAEVNWWLVALLAVALIIRLTAFFARRPMT